jgi:hypothetical protein
MSAESFLLANRPTQQSAAIAGTPVLLVDVCRIKGAPPRRRW